MEMLLASRSQRDEQNDISYASFGATSAEIQCDEHGMKNYRGKDLAKNPPLAKN